MRVSSTRLRTWPATVLCVLTFGSSVDLAAQESPPAAESPAAMSRKNLRARAQSCDEKEETDPSKKERVGSVGHLADDLQTRIPQLDATLDCLNARYLEIRDPIEAAAFERQEIEPFRRESVDTRAAEDFHGVKFGVGFGAAFGIGDDRVEAASIVNGLVQVSEDRTNEARVFLEFHSYCPMKWCPCGQRKEGVACGPFATVAATSDNIVEGVGAGWMFGWRDSKPGANDGFSVAIGVMLDNDVQVLAPGFEEGQPPPNGETTVRFLTESKASAIVFFGRSF